MDVWSHDHADRLERLKRLDGMKDKNKATGEFGRLWEISVFPLDKTYHGCPLIAAPLGIVWHK
ncbi:MAG: hypothetical protein A2076_08130 [Geobacteraceae bacterium GWC2_53_11]|nr:MAG: hypothetical protein A2076_08130 [Geobacteraceae bacterium GWC2_53_11]